MGKLRRIALLTAREGPVRAWRSAAAHRVHEHLHLLRAGWRPRDGRVVRGDSWLPLDERWAISLWLEPLTAAGFAFSNAAAGEFLITAPDGTRFVTGATGLVDLLSALHERYVLREYESLDVAGAVVVDVGAYVGDSALYFARAGARKVYAYEPFEPTFRAAARNVALNSLGGSIELRNAGVGAETATVAGVLVGEAPMLSSTAAGDSAAAGTAERVDILPLTEVIRDARNANPGARLVCKLDCEGAEFDVLSPGAVPALRAVDQLIVEYHYRSPQPIADVLQAAGMTVTELDERRRTEPAGVVGMLLATRPRPPQGIR